MKKPNFKNDLFAARCAAENFVGVHEYKFCDELDLKMTALSF